MRFHIVSQASIVWLILNADACAVTFYGPPTVNYRRVTDSPFFQGVSSGSIYLEDFEDHLLNTPYVTTASDFGGTGLVSSLSELTARGIHSVDADDGVLDLLGANGDAFVPGNASPFYILFQRDPIGRLPFYAGFVVTEVNRSVQDLYLEVYGPDGTMLGRQTWRAGQDGDIDQSNGIPSDSRNDVPLFPPGLCGGDTFIGAYAAEGIAELRFGRAYQIDHLQYGYAIPEPRSLLMAVAMGGLLFRRRKRNHVLVS